MKEDLEIYCDSCVNQVQCIHVVKIKYLIYDGAIILLDNGLTTDVSSETNYYRFNCFYSLFHRLRFENGIINEDPLSYEQNEKITN